ncbi:MAG: amidohydrolase [Synergistetes bacterium]|nr:amidohydrolase [Synergistota bacterium]
MCGDSVLIENATWISISKRKVRRGKIWIENGIIKKLGDFDSPEGVAIIDGGGSCILPGFVNAHVHSPMVLLRGRAEDLPFKRWLEEAVWPRERFFSREDIYWGSLLAIMEMIKSGITCFLDHYFYMDEVASACQEAGIRAVLAVGMGGRSYGFKDGIYMADNWHNALDGRIKVAFGPHSVYMCDRSLLVKIAEEAIKRKLKVHIHLLESEEERNTSIKIHGKDPISLLEELGYSEVPLIAVHLTCANDKEIERLSCWNVAVVHCPTSNLKLGMGIAPLYKFIKGGMDVALGTDGAASNNSLSIWGEMKLAPLLQKGFLRDATLISAWDALEMATLGGAKTLGFDRLGDIKEGWEADLVFLNLDSIHYVGAREEDIVYFIVYAGRESDVSKVMVKGRVIYDEGRFLTLDEDFIKKEVFRRIKVMEEGEIKL